MFLRKINKRNQHQRKKKKKKKKKKRQSVSQKKRISGARLATFNMATSASANGIGGGESRWRQHRASLQ